MVDGIEDASDDFESLPAVLPLLRSPSLPETAPFFGPYLNDDFARWQLDRFNRSGIISICSIFSASLAVIAKHYKLLILSYLLFFIPLIICFFHNSVYLFAILHALTNLLATSVTFSLIAGDRFYARFPLIFSKQGLTAFLIQLVKSFLLYQTLKCLCARSSTLTVHFLLLVIARYVTFFHSCFVFEGFSLSFAATCAFSLQLAFFAVPLAQLLGLFVSGLAMGIVAPATLGMAAWAAYFMRALVFLAVCGSGTNIQNVPGM
jgi:hypothetical protein